MRWIQVPDHKTPQAFAHCFLLILPIIAHLSNTVHYTNPYSTLKCPEVLHMDN